MGFLSNIISAAVKTVLTPIVVVKDVVNIITDEEADATKKHIESTIQDVEDAMDSII